MTSSYVSDVGASHTVFTGQFFMGLAGCSYGSHRIPVQRRMGTFVFRGGHRFKVAPTNTRFLFALVMNKVPLRYWANLLFVGPSVGTLPVSDHGVAVLVNSPTPDPTRSLVATVGDGVTVVVRDHFLCDSAMSLEPSVRLTGLHATPRRLGDLREASAATVAKMIRFGHRVASLVEVACIGRGVSAPRPHYIGGHA